MNIVSKDGRLVAVYLPTHAEVSEGTSFLTPPDSELQMGMLNWKSNHSCAPHTHIASSERSIRRTNEAYFVQDGCMDVELFDDGGEKIAGLTLQRGDVLLCLSGGHSFTAYTNCRVVEIKQGPFVGSDKVMLR